MLKYFPELKDMNYQIQRVYPVPSKMNWNRRTPWHILKLYILKTKTIFYKFPKRKTKHSVTQKRLRIITLNNRESKIAQKAAQHLKDKDLMLLKPLCLLSPPGPDAEDKSLSMEVFLLWLTFESWRYGMAVSYTHLTLPTRRDSCRSRWSPYH